MSATLPAPELPPEPERPDCCFGGCAQCVLDDYAVEMRQWRMQCAEIIRRQQAAGANLDGDQVSDRVSGK